MSLKTPCNLALNHVDGAFTTSLGNPYQCFTTFTVKSYFLVFNLNFLCSKFEHLLLVSIPLHGFLLHSLWLYLRAGSMKSALKEMPSDFQWRWRKKVGFIAWLPILFLSSIILRVRQLLTNRSTCIILHTCRWTLCWGCCKFLVCTWSH